MTYYLNKALLILVLIIVTQSCVPTQHIQEADTATPESYGALPADTVNSSVISWREFFEEPELISLIDTALAHNQELNIFLQQITIAESEVGERTGEYLPSVGYGAGADLEKVGEYTRNGAVEKNLPIKDQKEFPEPLTNYKAGFTANWEIDIWKKLRNAKKAAVMEYLGTIEGRNFLVTNLVAEVARAYFELEALDSQLTIIEQNLEIQKNALQIVKMQKQTAQTNELAVLRFEAEVMKSQSEKFAVKQEIVEVENELNFLIGRYPAPIERNSSAFLEKQVDTVFTGLPSQLLLNRPDIKRAEYDLTASKLNVKVARANFFPKVGLSAGIGLEAFQPQFISITPQALLYNLTAELAGPLINRKAIKAEYSRANARQLAAVFEYERAILSGYIEVTNDLANLENIRISYDYKYKQVDALNKSINVSTMLYQSARADYMEVLLTQRDALESKLELVETKKNHLHARINLYRALGGGWR